MALTKTQTQIPVPLQNFNNESDIKQLFDIIIRMKTELDRTNAELVAIDTRLTNHSI